MMNLDDLKLTVHAAERFSERVLGRIICMTKYTPYKKAEEVARLKVCLLDYIRDRDLRKMTREEEICLRRTMRKNPIFEEHTLYWICEDLVLVIKSNHILTVYFLSDSKVSALESVRTHMRSQANCARDPADASTILVPHCTNRQHPFATEYAKKGTRSGKLSNRTKSALRRWQIAEIYHSYAARDMLTWLKHASAKRIASRNLDQQDLGLLSGGNDKIDLQGKLDLREKMRSNPLHYAPPEGECFQSVLDRVKEVLPNIIDLLDNGRGPVLVISPVSVLIALRICLEDISDVEEFLRYVANSALCHPNRNTLYYYTGSEFELLAYNL